MTDRDFIRHIQEQVDILGRKVNASRTSLVVRWEPTWDGSAHVEVDGIGYSYVYCERGSEFQRKRASSLGELLYFILSDVVSEMALRYEISHRQDGEDSRRAYFRKEIDLMSQLNPVWGERKKAEIVEILQSSPFVDDATRFPAPPGDAGVSWL